MTNRNSANRKPSKPIHRQVNPKSRLKKNVADLPDNMKTARPLQGVKPHNQSKAKPETLNRAVRLDVGQNMKGKSGNTGFVNNRQNFNAVKKTYATANNGTNQNVNNKMNSESGKNPEPGVKNGQKPNSKNMKKTNDKTLYLVYTLAAIALILLVMTVIHFLKDGEPESEDNDVTKVDNTTESEIVSPVEEGIASNIYFGDISLGGMEYADFEKAITEKSDTILKKFKIDLKNEKDENNEKKSSLNAFELGISLDLEKIYQNAEKLNDLIKQSPSQITNLFFHVVKAEAMVGNNDKPAEITELADVKDDKYNLHPIFVIDEKALKNAVEDFSAKVEIKPGKLTATGFNLETLEFEFGEGTKGYKLETEKLINELKQAFSGNKLNESIKLKFIESDEIPEEEQNIEFGFISSGLTELVSHDPARDSNVKRVAELLSGIVVQPGEEFSYWTNINPISVENGYTYGGAIADDGSYESVIGGGVCQGSSTLYLALVRADLEITERNNHTIPSAYAIEGIDAMVADWSDLKFVNNTGYPIAIVGYYVDSTSIEFQIYGKKLPPGVTIDLDPQFVSYAAAKPPKKVVNKDLKPGEEVVVKNEVIGSYWTTDKVYYRDGVEYDRVHFNDSYYWSYAGVIEYNPDSPDSTTTKKTTEKTTEKTIEESSSEETSEQTTEPTPEDTTPEDPTPTTTEAPTTAATTTAAPTTEEPQIPDSPEEDPSADSGDAEP
ncbi:MAG TPA: VanW family protein [Clostridiaceae bacterium]|nr:VanW family protein [Clostridiaceae bacterium]